jgi:hypothetical protein
LKRAKQVMGSLFLSFIVIGVKSQAVPEIISILRRRKELVVIIELLQKTVERAALSTWLEDVVHDEQQRKDTLGSLGLVDHSADESAAIEAAVGTLTRFQAEVASNACEELPVAAHGKPAMHFNFDRQHGRLLCGIEIDVRGATPGMLVAFQLNCSKHSRSSSLKRTGETQVTQLEHKAVVNGHHTKVCYSVQVGGAGRSHGRTFAFRSSLLAKKSEANPLTYVMAAVPMINADKVASKTVEDADPAESSCYMRLTQPTSEPIVRIEFACLLDFKGPLPHSVEDTASLIPIATEMYQLFGMQVYFQQVLRQTLGHLGHCEEKTCRQKHAMLSECAPAAPMQEDVG